MKNIIISLSAILVISGTVAERVYVQRGLIVTNSATLKIKKKQNIILVESTQ